MVNTRAGKKTAEANALNAKKPAAKGKGKGKGSAKGPAAKIAGSRRRLPARKQQATATTKVPSQIPEKEKTAESLPKGSERSRSAASFRDFSQWQAKVGEHLATALIPALKEALAPRSTTAPAPAAPVVPATAPAAPSLVPPPAASPQTAAAAAAHTPGTAATASPAAATATATPVDGGEATSIEDNKTVVLANVAYKDLASGYANMHSFYHRIALLGLAKTKSNDACRPYLRAIAGLSLNATKVYKLHGNEPNNAARLDGCLAYIHESMSRVCDDVNAGYDADLAKSCLAAAAKKGSGGNGGGGGSGGNGGSGGSGGGKNKGKAQQGKQQQDEHPPYRGNKDNKDRDNDHYRRDRR